MKWQQMSSHSSEYRDKLIDAFPRCLTCDTVCHTPATCPLRICSVCTAQGHSSTQCPQRTCIQCKKQGHDQKDCPDFKCQLCEKAGHSAKDCPSQSQTASRPRHSIRGGHPGLYGPN